MPAPKKKKSEYNYVRKYFTFDGVKYEVVGATEEEALVKKLQKLRELEASQIDSSVTVRKWAETWLSTYVKPRKITAKTYAQYERCVKQVIIPEIGAQKLRKVTSVRLQQLLNTREGKSLSDVTKTRNVLKAMFHQAAQSRVIPFDPADGLVLPSSTKGSRRSLTDAERRALIAVANYPSFDGKPNRSGAWLMTLLLCGLRPGESAALTWRDVDLEKKLIRVKEAKESGSSTIKAPKTSAGVRPVPIPDELLPWLQSIRRPSGYVFTQKDGKTPLSETSMRRRWETVKKYMDIELGARWEKVKLPGQRRRSLVILEHALAEDLDLYDLRHTYCTDLQKKGVPLNVAKVLMGHADIATTANIYTHADDYTVEAARDLINKPL